MGKDYKNYYKNDYKSEAKVVNPVKAEPIPEEVEVKSDKVSEPVKQMVMVNSGSPLNLRKYPATGTVVLANLNPGLRIELIGYEDDDWAKVKYGDLFGYVMRCYIREV